jgi:hypothetical protein
MLDVQGMMLADQLRRLLCQERQAASLAGELAGQVGDDSSRRQLEEMHRDKLRHVQLVERLLEIVE